MPLIPLPANSIVNVQMFGTVCNQRVINLFQYQVTTTPAPGTDYGLYLDALFNSITAATRLYDRFLAAQANNYTLDFIRLQPVYPTRLRFIDYPQGAAGGYVDPANTANAATSIERFGRLGARRGIGRVQLVIPTGPYIDGLVIGAGYVTRLNALALEMQTNYTTAITVASWQPVIHNPAALQPLTVVVEGAIPKGTVRTMHRRTVGLGI